MNESSDSDTDPMLTPPEGVSPTRENNVKQFTDRSLQSDINDTVKICKLQRPITVDLEDLSDEECTTPPMVTPSEGVMPEFANSPSLKITKVLQKLSFSDIQNAPKSVLSPTSPSSVFSKSVIAAMDDCILDGVLLSQWDNILGPRIRHLWLTSSPQGFTLDMLNHVATQTLCGDICRDPESPHIDTKLYIVKEKNIVIHTFIFGAMGKADLAVHSLSLIIALAEYTSYLQVHNLCSTWMHRLLAKLRVLLEKGPTSAAMQSFTAYLEDFIMMLASLRQYGVPCYIPLSRTAFHRNDKDGNFLRKAILSHLMTSGHSLVVGQSPASVNLMIATLAMFLTSSERACSRYISQASVFHPDLNLQGLLKDGQAGMPEVQAICVGQSPVTVIDMDTREVRRSSITKHLLRRQEMLQDELLSLWKGQHESNIYTFRSLCKTVNDTESLVTNFMEEMAILQDNSSAKETYILHFTRMLKQKALSLIEYVEAETNAGKTPLKKSLKKLKADQGLSLNGDFNIVLASADKLRPGISSLLLGDVKHDTEHMQSLTDSY